jgi:membrane protein implicated in regulation of membrane protease activity
MTGDGRVAIPELHFLFFPSHPNQSDFMSGNGLVVQATVGLERLALFLTHPLIKPGEPPMTNDYKTQIRVFDQHRAGIVEQPVSLHTRGRVAYSGSHWFAILLSEDCQKTLQEGSIVRIVGRRGITLLVQSL